VSLSRRTFVRWGSLAGLGVGGLLAAVRGAPVQSAQQVTPAGGVEHTVPMGAMGPAVVLPSHGGLVPTRVEDLPADMRDRLRRPAGFEPGPAAFLERFDYGTLSRTADGRTVREYALVARDVTLEVAPGVSFPAWTYNGSVPGPTLRATEGDRMRVHFANASDHPHTIHFHSVHPAGMDGVFEQVMPGESFVYEMDAEPFGFHHYHCHTMPLARHIAKGLYGGLIVDPRGGRPRVDREMVMVMAGFDVDFDDENDFYVVNGPAFYYQNNPIRIRVGERIRIYLSNMLEFDPINSFHLHANFFDYFPTGTRLEPSVYTDTIALAQGERGILEFAYRHPGRYLFHAHKTEFAELGWTGTFEVVG
jgi:FtsP/CotA-like multicopper oxidase with cupredoxin domain